MTREIHKKLSKKYFDWLELPDVVADVNKYGFQVISLLEEEK
jgi:hypothetical protein